jgi:hypothetical protein
MCARAWLARRLGGVIRLVFRVRRTGMVPAWARPMRLDFLVGSAVLGVVLACSSGTSLPDGDSGSGGLQASGGNASGGEAPGGAGATGGSATGGGATGGSGAGGQRACGTAGLSCPSNELCVETVFYPNNIDPNNVMPPNTSWACKENPCGAVPLSCECARSVCNLPECSVSGMKLVCVFRAVCASPDTRIATPTGEREIADLRPGDLVYSVDGLALRPVPILRVAKTAVAAHHVVELRMADGSVMEISPGHPTADGRSFGELRAGDKLDGALVVSSRLVEYRYSHTYDILPDSDTGSYVAFGKVIGSTLK